MLWSVMYESQIFAFYFQPLFVAREKTVEYEWWEIKVWKSVPLDIISSNHHFINVEVSFSIEFFTFPILLE